jgi:hypothetical protein
MKYKTVFVPAIPAKVVGEGFLSGGQEKDADCWIDGEALAEACNQLSTEGY